MKTLRKVIIANDFAFVNGGQAQVAIDNAIHLAGSGLEVVFFAACGPVDPRLRRPEIEVICLEHHDILSDPDRTRAIVRGLWNREVAGALHALCHASDPETSILHCHGFCKALSPSVGPVLTSGPLRSLFTMHEFFLACPNGGFFDYRAGEICTRRAMGLSCLTTNCDVRNYAHKGWRVIRTAILNNRAGLPGRLRDVIYISELQRRIMAPYLAAGTHLHHLPNPVPSADHQVDAASNSAFLFIGRLSPEKGGLRFAEAARKAGAKAVFVGDGPEADSIASANPDAIITGWLDRGAVDEWLEQARCLVFPSTWYETFGLVVYEALQRGIPVICGTWTAAAEVVRHGETGLLLQRPDTDELAEAISQIATPDHPVFSRIGGIDIPSLTSEAHTEQLIGLYQRILDRV